MPTTIPHTARHLAFQALRDVQHGAFADAALEKRLAKSDLSGIDRRLATELVYGTVRRQRTLDAIIDQLAAKPAQHQPADVRLLLHLGLYQLRYLNQIPASAAVHTTVELTKQIGFAGLTGFVNGLLRHYLRLASEALPLPADPVSRLGIQHSFPDWIIQVWLDQLDLNETEQLCDWMNQSPHLILRVNPLRATIAQVEAAFAEVELSTQRLPHLPQALQLPDAIGSVQALPGFGEGWWMVQDGSAQLVSYLVDPQPGEVIVDACAAPGGKTLHLAELMQDSGTIWACDRAPSRLKKLQQNATRLGLQSIQSHPGDSRELPFTGVDRVLIDAPCSGLGTLNRHADARWRQTPATVQELADLQQQILDRAATWLKPGGTLVYATCTLHPAENERQIATFLAQHPDWQIDPPESTSPVAPFQTEDGWVKVWSHRQHMDGFFMARLKKP